MKAIRKQLLPSILCFFVISTIFLWMNHGLERKKYALRKKIAALNALKEKELALNDTLKACLNSHHDQDYLELLLMQKLGCVPQGYKKVIFPDKNAS